MKTKWQYIASRCEAEGFSESAKIAKKIDKVLRKLYGKKHTLTWANDYKFLDSMTIFSVAKSLNYCIACEVHEVKCDFCDFGKEVGKCGDELSLYRNFVKTFLSERKILK